MTQREVKYLFDYLPSGELVWLICCKYKKTKGKIAGSMTKEGYYRAKIAGKSYLIHRLIYLWHYGELPEFIDHKNGIPSDNRIENLRPATRTENNCNKKVSKNATSVYLGVSWHKATQKWQARITTHKQNHLGIFAHEEDAAMVYNEAALELHGEFARLNNHPLNTSL